MATLILSTIGYAVGGPIGGAVGSFIGQFVDHQLLAPKMRSPRLPDIDVQLSVYGTVVPRIYGRMRVAGSLIWSTGLTETAYSTGGKSSGGRRTQYIYSSNFAIALSSRPIQRVLRIWADGKLITTNDGQLLGAGRMRVYQGSERQQADPLIAAREGLKAPCYRGMAYVVFEDLPLADYANRIPNLTFEVEADDQKVRTGAIIEDLAQSTGTALQSDVDSNVAGFAATRGQSVADYIELLDHFGPRAVLRDAAEHLYHGKSSDMVYDVPADWLGAYDALREQKSDDHLISATLPPPQNISISYFDIDRDYQPGIQSASLRQGMASENIDLALPVAMRANRARSLAAKIFVRRSRESARYILKLPMAALQIEAGDIVRLPDQSLWRVESWSLEAMIVELRLHSLDSSDFPMLQAESGRLHQVRLPPPSATVLRIFETRNWRGTDVAGPELWVAVAAQGANWRGAEVQYSSSQFSHWAQTPFLDMQNAMGHTKTALDARAAQMWDETQLLIVAMENPALRLMSMRVDDILDGHNLALIGDEIIAYRKAALVATGVYRLSGLLRGLYGTSPVAHRAGQIFTALDAQRLFCICLPAHYIGRTLEFRAHGPGDVSEAASVVHVVQGLAMNPLAPVHIVVAPPLENQTGPPPPPPPLPPPAEPEPEPPVTKPVKETEPELGPPFKDLVPELGETLALTDALTQEKQKEPPSTLSPPDENPPAPQAPQPTQQPDVISQPQEPVRQEDPSPPPPPLPVEQEIKKPDALPDYPDLPDLSDPFGALDGTMKDPFSDLWSGFNVDRIRSTSLDMPVENQIIWSWRQSWRAGLEISWTPRMRNGFMWLDGADVCADAQGMSFDVTLTGDRDSASWRITACYVRVDAETLARIASPDAKRLRLSVAHVSALCGAGEAYVADIILENNHG